MHSWRGQMLISAMTNSRTYTLLSSRARSTYSWSRLRLCQAALQITKALTGRASADFLYWPPFETGMGLDRVQRRPECRLGQNLLDVLQVRGQRKVVEPWQKWTKLKKDGILGELVEIHGTWKTAQKTTPKTSAVCVFSFLAPSLVLFCKYRERNCAFILHS